MRNPEDNALGRFLQERRRRLDPAGLGYSMSRRRTPGLRREEVAQRANVSPAWYTWLEQGRGGTPSPDVLDRLARGLDMNDTEREYLFLLAQSRPFEKPKESQTVGPELQRIVDSLEFSPAVIRTPAWDVLAANRAARFVLAPGVGDHESYNILERFFQRMEAQGAEDVWMAVARAVVAQFRLDTVRAGFGTRARQIVDGMLAASPAFRTLWNEVDVGLKFEPVKTFAVPGHGVLSFSPVAFSVDDYPGLKLVVFTPATDSDRDTVRDLLRT